MTNKQPARCYLCDSPAIKHEGVKITFCGECTEIYNPTSARMIKALDALVANYGVRQ